ncbi:FMN-linked oxidoreductase [Mycena sanguinolenta]|uniref:FMN-linked oxidoreductase n=1 Tax=Mycena sanguinolenta TaxID=230812 RepID=A0A8H6XGB3_9AGAR|nr:FMN-linked oxidoreductase [Mycena sanguinolenta]
MPRAGGYKHQDSWSDDQIFAWKAVTDRVHAKGFYMHLQLWALGRTADVEDSLPYASVSDVPPHASPAHSLRNRRICPALRQCRAPRRSRSTPPTAMYLLAQFPMTAATPAPTSTACRVLLDVVKAVGRAASPWGTVEGMQSQRRPLHFPHYPSPGPIRFPLAYLHVVEPRVDGSYTVDIKDGYPNDFIRGIWGARRRGIRPRGRAPLRLQMKTATWLRVHC